MKLMLATGLAGALAAVGARALAAPAAAGAIPFKRADVVAGADVSAGALGILALSLLAIGAVWLVRRRLNMGPLAPGAAGAVRIVETQRLGPKALLTVVEFGGRQHLLAQTEHGVACLVSEPAAQGSA